MCVADKVVVRERERTGDFMSSTTLYNISAQAERNDVIAIKVETPRYNVFIYSLPRIPRSPHHCQWTVTVTVAVAVDYFRN